MYLTVHYKEAMSAGSPIHHPQVIFKYFDAFTGELRYSESIVIGMKN